MTNRNEIFENALNIFAAYGYDGASVQQICDASGITKPTLYHYFHSKRGLLDQILKETLTPFIYDFQAACVYNHDLPLSLERVMRASFGFAGHNPVFYRLQQTLRSAPPRSEGYASIKPWLETQHRILETLFMAAVEDHGNLRGRSAAYSLSLLGVINAYILTALDEGKIPSDAQLYQARQQFMYGIFS